MTINEELLIEIAKHQARHAIMKMCKDRKLGSGSYNRIIMELFFDDLPAHAGMSDIKISTFLRELADQWEAYEGYEVEDDKKVEDPVILHGFLVGTLLGLVDRYGDFSLNSGPAKRVFLDDKKRDVLLELRDGIVIYAYEEDIETLDGVVRAYQAENPERFKENWEETLKMYNIKEKEKTEED